MHIISWLTQSSVAQLQIYSLLKPFLAYHRHTKCHAAYAVPAKLESLNIFFYHTVKNKKHTFGSAEMFCSRPKRGGVVRTQRPSRSGHMLQDVARLVTVHKFIHARLLVIYVNYVSVHMHRHDKPIWMHFYMLMRSR